MTDEEREHDGHGGAPRDRKTRRGYVVSDKMDKTVVVEVEDRVKHPLYGKVIRRTSKVKAHDELSSAGVGDLVLIMETRPLQRHQAVAPGRGPREGQVSQHAPPVAHGRRGAPRGRHPPQRVHHGNYPFGQARRDKRSENPPDDRSR